MKKFKDYGKAKILKTLKIISSSLVIYKFNFTFQSLLSNINLPEECFSEVKNFVTKQPNMCGSLSLQTLCASNIQDASQLLLNFAPQALFQFAKVILIYRNLKIVKVEIIHNTILFLFCRNVLPKKKIGKQLFNNCKSRQIRFPMTAEGSFTMKKFSLVISFT